MPVVRTCGKETERLVRQAEEALANTRVFLDELQGSETAAHIQIEAFAEDLERRIARLKEEK